MLRRLLIILLAFSVFGYGGALAFDMHGSQAADPTHAVAGTDDLSGDQGHASDADHCCHGVTHLLGLGSSIAPGLHFDKLIPVAAHAADFHSFTPPALLRPPIAA